MKTRQIRPLRMGIESMKLPEKIYPTLHLSLESLPEAKNWQIGKLYQIEMTVKQTAIRQDKQGGDVTFEIRKVGVDDDEAEDLKEYAKKN